MVPQGQTRSDVLNSISTMLVPSVLLEYKRENGSTHENVW